VRYHPETKCCTYRPQLPNFLVGAVLTSGDPSLAAGRDALVHAVGTDLLATPLCVGPPEDYWRTHTDRPEVFGRDPSRVCRLHIGGSEGGCGIWRHRPAHCSTWFCRYVDGPRGVVFWRSLERLLVAIEGTLSRWCLLCMDVEPAVLRRVFPPRGQPIELGHPETLWGSWWGRETELFEASWRLVEPLAWSDLVEIGGSDLQLRATLARDALQRLRRGPASLRLGHVQKTENGDNGHARVWTYNTLDPVDVPRDVLETVREWDRPRSREEALAEGAKAGVDEPWLDRLIRFGVLVEGDDA
jgi:hypothetical protein